MTEQQWELYRLSVVVEWPESLYKATVIGAIKHKLMILALQNKASIKAPDTPTYSQNHVTRRETVDSASALAEKV